MSSSGLEFRGTPNTQKTDDEYFNIYPYCGGLGAGECIEPLGVEGIVIGYKVSKMIVYNRLVTFQNNSVNITTDAGPAGLCSSSAGTSVDFYIGLSSSSSEDIYTVASSGTLLNDPIGDIIEFRPPNLPQPTDSAWQAVIYLYIWWGDSTYVNAGGFLTDGILVNNQAFSIIKHDNDIRI